MQICRRVQRHICVFAYADTAKKTQYAEDAARKKKDAEEKGKDR
jgi:hypothetical protein